MVHLIMGVAKMTTISYDWQVQKHFSNNLRSHCAWHVALHAPSVVYYSTLYGPCKYLQLGLYIKANICVIIYFIFR